MNTEPYTSASDTVSAKRAVAIVNGEEFPVCRGLYTGTGGAINMRFVQGGTDGKEAFELFEDVPAGAVMPFQLVEVSAADTTATGLKALY